MCHHKFISLGFQFSPDLKTSCPFRLLFLFLGRFLWFFWLFFLLALGFFLCFLSSFNTDNQNTVGSLFYFCYSSTSKSDHDLRLLLLQMFNPLNLQLVCLCLSSPHPLQRGPILYSNTKCTAHYILVVLLMVQYFGSWHKKLLHGNDQNTNITSQNHMIKTFLSTVYYLGLKGMTVI